MTQPYKPFNPHMRLSDNERSDAMSALGRALAEGRLTFIEYENRVEAVLKAETCGQLEPLFRDIPQSPAIGNEMVLYSANEIAETHERGQKTRLGLFGLSVVGSSGLGILMTTMGMTGGGIIPLLVIPTVFILLYIMKIGPEKWYAPSPRQLERQRFREIQAAQALEVAQQKAERRQQMNQLTGEAVSLAQRALDKWKESDKK
ncbi:DUF1707 domain-containing protein [Corynebacterium breve]|uniref:DUF1707 domain-containing protein n=1 Tax=Corynebacterium breve TaxID=3049799 RepID=A0ABY8VET9_9CORY|nr:DUF1707 domain-containing protein [Corynebacterium breve]WIM67476.1 DUF1707 domain-containing protein [Corynebacterium breve]